ncbi:hypothetical protein [Pseudomonas sp.]|uniref:hypothetical protein n=1 Tax=Pseudomonas sp. TaxID=306 RepID=UPI003CC60D64
MHGAYALAVAGQGEAFFVAGVDYGVDLVSARDAGVNMAVSRLIDVPLANGGMERVFATRRFDREGAPKYT